VITGSRAMERLPPSGESLRFDGFQSPSWTRRTGHACGDHKAPEGSGALYCVVESVSA
jgi:hypothetical protein